MTAKNTIAKSHTTLITCGRRVRREEDGRTTAIPGVQAVSHPGIQWRTTIARRPRGIRVIPSFSALKCFHFFDDRAK